jgi:hypothetical protein
MHWEHCNKALAPGTEQVPQLSTSYPMHLATKFEVKPPGAQRTKALFIGINYVGHKQGQLSGCHNGNISFHRISIESDTCILVS